MSAYSNAEKAACLLRELGWRRYVYPKRVADGRMTQFASDKEIAIMEAILADYQALVERDNPDLFKEKK